MKVIWKYVLTSSMELPLHEGAVILSVQEQRDSVAMWVNQDTEQLLESRKFAIIPTGTPHDLDEKAIHLGTVQLHDGSIVVHVFEV